MRKLPLCLFFILLFFLFFGCVQPDPVIVAKKDPVVKDFLLEHGFSNLKSVLFSSAEIGKMGEEIVGFCGSQIPLKDSYKVSYADFNSGESVNAWVGKASNKVVCSYLQDLDSGVKNACFGGVFNKDTNKCEGEVVIKYVCSVGKYEAISGKCLVFPDVNFVCAKGIYDSNLGKCIFNPQIQMTCVQGDYDSNLGKCIFVPQIQVICSKGVYDSVSDTCEYSPPVNNVCSIGNYDETTQTCIYDPVNITCSSQNGFVCTASQTCNGELITASDTDKCCKTSCVGESPDDLDIPWSFFAVHFEINNSGKGPATPADTWQNMVNTVELANQYNVPLTIMFWPGSAEYALVSSERIAQVREWQAQGHEIGLHNQGCYGTDGDDASAFHKESDNALYEQLAGDYTLKSGTTVCTSNIISTYKYEGGGRPDGRSAVAIKHDESGHWVYGLNIKAGYANGTSIKTAQYNTLNKDEIYGFVNHGEGDAGNMGGTVELKEWLLFLYEKDPEGKKRRTLSGIMEEYVLPNNLVVSMEDVCSSTDTRVQQCLALNRIETKSGTNKCMNPYDAGAFNFGRCLHTGTYCGLEDGLSQEQLCSISRGDYYTYVPTSCVVKNISDYEPVVCNNVVEVKTCSELGGTICTKEQTCSGKIKIASDTKSCCTGGSCLGKEVSECGDGYCDGTAGEKTSCPADCSKQSSCGDGYCDGPAGEKTSCPQDC
ncbi:MAG: hypothetical protein WC462_04900 [archaeon]